MIDEKKLIDFIDAGKFRNADEICFSENDVVRLIKNFTELSNELGLNEQPKTDWIPCEDVLSMSESDFITHILSTICDYAKVNNYEITETVKAMGENLIALTEIANFDKWKEGVTDDE